MGGTASCLTEHRVRRIVAPQSCLSSVQHVLNLEEVGRIERVVVSESIGIDEAPEVGCVLEQVVEALKGVLGA